MPKASALAITEKAAIAKYEQQRAAHIAKRRYLARHLGVQTTARWQEDLAWAIYLALAEQVAPLFVIGFSIELDDGPVRINFPGKLAVILGDDHIDVGCDVYWHWGELRGAILGTVEYEHPRMIEQLEALLAKEGWPLNLSNCD